jgi:predicted double-glycine peptidase
MFSSIHEIVFHGNGGYDWNTVYNMPIWLRKFTFNKIKKYFEEQNNPAEDSNTLQLDNKTKIPDVVKNVIHKKPSVKAS